MKACSSANVMKVMLQWIQENVNLHMEALARMKKEANLITNPVIRLLD
jgi:hypothetical protein